MKEQIQTARDMHHPAARNRRAATPGHGASTERTTPSARSTPARPASAPSVTLPEGWATSEDSDLPARS